MDVSNAAAHPRRCRRRLDDALVARARRCRRRPLSRRRRRALDAAQRRLVRAGPRLRAIPAQLAGPPPRGEPLCARWWCSLDDQCKRQACSPLFSCECRARRRQRRQEVGPRADRLGDGLPVVQSRRGAGLRVEEQPREGGGGEGARGRRRQGLHGQGSLRRPAQALCAHEPELEALKRLRLDPRDTTCIHDVTE